MKKSNYNQLFNIFFKLFFAKAQFFAISPRQGEEKRGVIYAPGM